MLIGDAVDERHQNVEPGLERAAILAETFNNVGRLLRNDNRRLEDGDQHHKRNEGEEYEWDHDDSFSFLWLGD